MGAAQAPPMGQQGGPFAQPPAPGAYGGAAQHPAMPAGAPGGQPAPPAQMAPPERAAHANRRVYPGQQDGAAGGTSLAPPKPTIPTYQVPAGQAAAQRDSDAQKAAASAAAPSVKLSSLNRVAFWPHVCFRGAGFDRTDSCSIPADALQVEESNRPCSDPSSDQCRLGVPAVCDTTPASDDLMRARHFACAGPYERAG
jgi:hypothetical protein